MIDEHITKDNRKIILILTLAISLIILIFGITHLYKFKECKDKHGFLDENNKCYIPSSEEERKEIMQKGVINHSFLLHKNINPFNISLP